MLAVAGRSLGLGLVVGAVLHSAAAAQVTTVRPDSAARADSVALRDSLAAADTIKSPLARAESPGIEGSWRWSREAVFASGAMSLAELLEVIPGVTSYRSGWISSPAAVAYLGDPDRVRVFYDGIELESLDPRTGGIHDLIEIPLWTIEEVRVERAADELRVHLRSWRVQGTVPITRTDFYTGDEDTNLYRGFFGKRFRNGAALQLGGQQYSTQSRRTDEAGDELSLFARAGWSRGAWSVDAAAVRSGRNRGVQSRQVIGTPIPPLDARRTDAYLRVAYGDPEQGRWAQLIAASQAFRETTPGTGITPTDPDEPVPDPDTARSMAQYVAAVGTTAGPLRLSLTNRLEVREGKHMADQVGRLAVGRGFSALDLFAERAASDSTMRLGVSGRLWLSKLLWVGGAASQRFDDEDREGAVDTRAYRGEIGTHIGGLSVSAGVLGRDSVVLRPLVVYDTAWAPRAEGAVLGPFATMKGSVWRDLFIDAHAVRWDAPGTYRPQWQSRVHLYLSTRWLSRFPTGNFGILLGATHEYRSEACFPRRDGTCDLSVEERVVTFRAELQIVRAVITFELDNPQLFPYQRVPGFLMPRGVSYYGVRWEFRN